jgi:hypothetical protein
MLNKLLKIANQLDDKKEYQLADKLERLAARQYMLPLEYGDPRYSGNALNFIPEDEIDTEDDDYGIYHVTTDLPSLLEGGLLSRNQLEKKFPSGRQGMGGRIPGQSDSQVSTTYSYERARNIYDTLQTVASILTGKMSLADALKNEFFTAEEVLEENFDEPYLRQFINMMMDKIELQLPGHVNLKPIKTKLFKDDMSAFEDLENIMVQHNINTPEIVYNLLIELETTIANIHSDIYKYSDEPQPLPIAGLAAPYEAIKDLTPENIALLELKARKDSPVAHYPQEEELNFYPWDLYIDHPELLPHERGLIQQITKPARAKKPSP